MRHSCQPLWLNLLSEVRPAIVGAGLLTHVAWQQLPTTRQIAARFTTTVMIGLATRIAVAALAVAVARALALGRLIAARGR